MMQFEWANFVETKQSVEATLERLHTFQPNGLYVGDLEIKDQSMRT